MKTEIVKTGKKDKMVWIASEWPEACWMSTFKPDTVEDRGVQ
jgi:hypothetical protein